jgi:hypothetical protein
MFTFLAVLLLAGVVYAWREGALRWARWLSACPPGALGWPG